MSGACPMSGAATPQAITNPLHAREKNMRSGIRMGPGIPQESVWLKTPQPVPTLRPMPRARSDGITLVARTRHHHGEREPGAEFVPENSTKIFPQIEHPGMM